MKKYFLSLFFLLYSFSLFSQNKYTISGYVQEAASGENLIGVSIYNKTSQKGTTSNQYGFYSIHLKKEFTKSFIPSLDWIQTLRK